MCSLLDGIWEVEMMILGLLSYLMKGSIVKCVDEKKMLEMSSSDS